MTKRFYGGLLAVGLLLGIAGQGYAANLAKSAPDFKAATAADNSVYPKDTPYLKYEGSKTVLVMGKMQAGKYVYVKWGETDNGKDIDNYGWPVMVPLDGKGKPNGAMALQPVTVNLLGDYSEGEYVYKVPADNSYVVEYQGRPGFMPNGFLVTYRFGDAPPPETTSSTTN